MSCTGSASTRPTRGGLWWCMRTARPRRRCTRLTSRRLNGGQSSSSPAWTGSSTLYAPRVPCGCSPPYCAYEHARCAARELQVDHHSDNFLIVNNGDGAKEFRLSVAPVSAPTTDNWEDVMPYNASTRITGVYPFANFVVVSGRSGGISRLWAMHLHTDGKPDVETKHQIAFADPLYAVEVR